jgi:hypothetical protein
MNITILNILCEGQTEEKFVKDVLKPYFSSLGIVLKSRLLITSKKKGMKGGLLSYAQAKNDLTLWMKEVSHRGSETHFFTTMFDFYALPDDFPNIVQSKSIVDPYLRIADVEEAFKMDIDADRFIPYIQLHEFEALMFCDITKLIIEYPKCSKEIESLENDLANYNGNPELINNSPETAPSKRIIAAIEGKHKYNYNKPRSGAVVTASIGLPTLMQNCRHFREWIDIIHSETGLIKNNEN